MTEHEHRWVDDSTYGDHGRGVFVFRCVTCGHRRELPNDTAPPDDASLAGTR